MRYFNPVAVRKSLAKYEKYSLIDPDTGECETITQEQALSLVARAVTIQSPSQIGKDRGELLKFNFQNATALLAKAQESVAAKPSKGHDARDHKNYDPKL